ncbi:helix-turn-helix transcriptional regulator [Candidatus Woesearchaeota archaeon]|nr:helix-turn-helix transcriptional regulator [Candidatus Woesearchaeota archaeon]
MDELELAVNPDKAQKQDIRLTPREQEVFMALYLNKELSSKDLARRLGFTESMVNMYLLNILAKGVPVKRELVDDVVVFGLESGFKDLQARRNVLDINPRIAGQLATHKPALF